MYYHFPYQTIYRVSQKKHSYKIFGLEIMLFTCSQTLWSCRLWWTPALCPISWSCCRVLTTMSASRWRAWSLVQKFYNSVFSGTPCIYNNLYKIFSSVHGRAWGYNHYSLKGLPDLNYTSPNPFCKPNKNQFVRADKSISESRQIVHLY